MSRGIKLVLMGVAGAALLYSCTPGIGAGLGALPYLWFLSNPFYRGPAVYHATRKDRILVDDVLEVRQRRTAVDGEERTCPGGELKVSAQLPRDYQKGPRPKTRPTRLGGQSPTGWRRWMPTVR